MVPLSDQILMGMGYDRGFIEGMRQFNRQVDIAAGLLWEREHIMDKLRDYAKEAERAQRRQAASSADIGERHSGPRDRIKRGAIVPAYAKSVMNTPIGQFILNKLKGDPRDMWLMVQDTGAHSKITSDKVPFRSSSR